MNGRSNAQIQGESVLWPDASLEGIQADYDAFILRITEDSGSTKVIRCPGYVGYQMVGFWDEVIIESSTIVSAHPFISECESRIKQLPEGGSADRSQTGNYLLEIVFIDGCKLWVCGKQFICHSDSK
jgi:hypothetical protein